MQKDFGPETTDMVAYVLSAHACVLFMHVYM